ncbi:DUF6273 domain-containing protein, partial [Lactococcus muris]
IQNGVMYDDGQNPLPNEDSAPADFDFSTMRPGRIFTMAGEQYRYLENMGSGNHMIIRNDAIRDTKWVEQDTVLVDWYDALDSSVQDIVQPVASNFVTGVVPIEGLVLADWIPINLQDDFPEAASDRTEVNLSGSPRAFALSLSDAVHLSGAGKAFPNQAASAALNRGGWWLRTPSESNRAWRVGSNGGFAGGRNINYSNPAAGIRPALIINPSN